MESGHSGYRSEGISKQGSIIPYWILELAWSNTGISVYLHYCYYCIILNNGTADMLCHAAVSHSFATQINGRMWVCSAAKYSCKSIGPRLTGFPWRNTPTQSLRLCIWLQGITPENRALESEAKTSHHKWAHQIHQCNLERSHTVALGGCTGHLHIGTDWADKVLHRKREKIKHYWHGSTLRKQNMSYVKPQIQTGMHQNTCFAAVGKMQLCISLILPSSYTSYLVGLK